MKESQKGAFLVILSMLIFGFYGIFVRVLNLPSFVILFYNFLFAGIVLFIIFFVKDKSVIRVKKYLWWLFLLGFLNTLNNFFYFQAFVLTTISNAVLTHYTAPIFVAILAPFLLGEKLDKITVIALLLSVLGVVIVSYSGFSFYAKDFLGILYGTASGLLYGLVIITVKYLSRHLSVYSINIYQSLIGALLLTPFIMQFGSVPGASALALLLLFSLLFGMAATLVYFAGIRRVKSQHAGILAYSEPISATLYAVIFFSEIPKWNTIIGGLLILVSGYFIIIKQK